MKIISLLICKLYDNFSFGNSRPSISQFRLSQISVSFIVLFWFYVLIYFLRTKIISLENTFTWLYIILLGIIFYFINKYAWSLNQVEKFINDKENEPILNKMKWVFWGLLIIPTILYSLIFKR